MTTRNRPAPSATDWGLLEYPKLLALSVIDSFGGGKVEGYSYRNIAGTNTLSDHATRTAFDYFNSPSVMQQMADWMIKQPGIKYVIYNRQIWTPEKGWHKYTGEDPHTGHVHTSIQSGFNLKAFQGFKKSIGGIFPGSIEQGATTASGKKDQFDQHAIDVGLATSSGAFPGLSDWQSITPQAALKVIGGVILVGIGLVILVKDQAPAVVAKTVNTALKAG